MWWISDADGIKSVEIMLVFYKTLINNSNFWIDRWSDISVVVEKSSLQLEMLISH